ncbi:PREDICTED: uncharacterized protein LOC108576094 [Habropoda laboriosa]|uniref:uncharacterized protein LOC108576094 n=1 Tax=Habropoda laboriosa TaxID=597456 RepID=UPI00083E25CB|nr:PREDICTED: uncharacterized protein LOC108576094 [Habropoda laboriosa]
MDNLEHRAVIKFFVKKGLTPIEIFTEMKNVLDDNAPSYTTVKKWAAEFKHGHTSLQDNSRSGRPKTATTEEIMIKVHNIVLQDRRLKVSEIARDVGISDERVHHILTKELGMKKLSARWVPRLLTESLKHIRMQDSQDCLDRFKKNTTDFIRRFVTTDETWIHHYTPESKEQSEQWKRSGSPPPKKAKSILSAGKVMASIFWDAKGILLVNYLPRGRTITGQYYSNLLDQLVEAIREKRPDDELIAAVNVYFEDLQEKDFRDGITGLEHRWMNCIEVQGDYVEK